jgi:hypothetical protein
VDHADIVLDLAAPSTPRAAIPQSQVPPVVAPLPPGITKQVFASPAPATDTALLEKSPRVAA